MYTKGEVSEHFPALQPFMQRDETIPTLLATLNETKDSLISMLKDVEVIQQGRLNLVRKWTETTQGTDKEIDSASPADFTGMVIDMKDERCVLFPPQVDQQLLASGSFHIDEECEVLACSFKVAQEVLFAQLDCFGVMHNGKTVQVSTSGTSLERFNSEKYYGRWVLKRDEQSEVIFYPTRLVGVRDKLTNDPVPLNELDEV